MTAFLAIQNVLTENTASYFLIKMVTQKVLIMDANPVIVTSDGKLVLAKRTEESV